jgi:drug/metabolite transporter (DMT)-like permease
MSLVIIGICLTVFGKLKGLASFKTKKADQKGYLFALCGSLANSIAVVFTRIGVRDYNPISATQIRVFTAIIGFAIVSLFLKRGNKIKNILLNTEGLKFTAYGALVGPFIGVSLSLFALQRVNAGIVSTLIGLTPILIIIPELIFLKRKIKPIEIAGAIIAVCGTTVFFL